MQNTTLNGRLLGDLQDALRADSELTVKGKFFTCGLLLGSGERRFLLRFREGELAEIIPDPLPVNPWRIAIKASEETWGKFLQDPPPPEFHECRVDLDSDVGECVETESHYWFPSG